MGGIGSGSYYRWNRKTTTNNANKIDIRFMRREGLLTPGTSGTLSWNIGGEPAGSIGYQVSSAALRLIYRRSDGEEWQDFDESIQFDWTSCNFGGRRQWFLCPHCGKRVAVLYGFNSGFLCRHCYNLPYACQSESKVNRLIRRLHKLADKLDLDDEFAKPKGMHWKTYDRLMDEYIRIDSLIDEYIYSAYRH